MTPLRKKMIEAMRVRGFAVRTHKSYLSAVSELARYYSRSPDGLGIDELQAFFVYLATDRELSGASCRLYLNAIRFLYLQVLEWPSFDVPIPIIRSEMREAGYELEREYDFLTRQSFLVFAKRAG